MKAQMRNPLKKKNQNQKMSLKLRVLKISQFGECPYCPARVTDVVLLKLLRAREFKINETFEMLKRTLIWRAHSEIETILDEDLGLRRKESSFGGRAFSSWRKGLRTLILGLVGLPRFFRFMILRIALDLLRRKLEVPLIRLLGFSKTIILKW